MDETNSSSKPETKQVLQEGDKEVLIRVFKEEMDLSESTARTYRASWIDFRSWCIAEGREPLPTDPYVLARYLEKRSDLAIGTLRNRLSAVGSVHQHVGLENPAESNEVNERMRAISQQKNSEEGRRSPTENLEAGPYAPSDILKGGPELLQEHLSRVFEQEGRTEANEPMAGRKKERERACALWRDDMIEKVEASSNNMSEGQKRLIPELEFNLSVMRGRVALLLMSEAKCTRAELTQLDLIDVFVEETEQPLTEEEEVEERLAAELVEGRSSLPTRKEVWIGVRETNGMPDRTLRLPQADNLRFCPARAIAAWIVGAGITEGPLLRPFGSHGRLKERRIGPSSVNLLVRKAAKDAGLDPDEWTPSRLTEEGSAC